MGHTDGADSETDRVSPFQEASCVYPEYGRMAADSDSRRLSSDGGIKRLSYNLWGALLVSTPTTLVVCLAVFILSLNSSIEQSALYRAARQALRAIPTGLSFVHKDSETKAIFRVSYWKTFVPTCALILLVIGLQYFRFDAGGLVHRNRVLGVKALNICGVPIPLWSTARGTFSYGSYEVSAND